MADQPSFRRFLLMRLLIFSIPILLLGMGVTYRKTRATLMETAHLHLTERATRRADGIRADLEAVKTQLAIASQTQTVQSSRPQVAQAYLLSLLQQFPSLICLQLMDLSTQELVESTCGTQPITTTPPDPWSLQQPLGSSPYSLAVVRAASRFPEPPDAKRSLEVVVSVPVYDSRGKLIYMLSGQTALQAEQYTNPLGYTIVLDQKGTILAHPLKNWAGHHALEMGDRNYQALLKNIQNIHSSGTEPLVDMMGDRSQWLVGASPVSIVVSPSESQTWTVLSVTRLEDALYSLNSITQTLVILTIGLVLANLFASIYTARGLARPIEKLGDYARQIQMGAPEPAPPQQLGVQELNQLASVLNNMVVRLEERATELETAWQTAEAANQLKSEFLATTSHELRTPLNAIIGCLQLVADGYCDSPDEERELLRQAEKAALHLLKVINDLLDIRSIEAGSIRLYLENVNVCQILNEVIDLQQVELQRKHLTLQAPDLSQPILVRADAGRLKQVVLNVVANAIKFTDAGHINIATHIEPRLPSASATSTNGKSAESEQPFIIINVKDTGIGIAPDQQQKLFRPFVMADGSTTRKFEGTGLGLAISRSLIERMGGTISLYSEGLQMGTCVEIALPILEFPPAGRGQDPASESVGSIA